MLAQKHYEVRIPRTYTQCFRVLAENEEYAKQAVKLFSDTDTENTWVTLGDAPTDSSSWVVLEIPSETT